MAGQDDAERVNGLMSAMNKKESENAALRARLAEFETQGNDSEAQEPAAPPVDSQPESAFEEGRQYAWDGESQAMVDVTPMARRPNGPQNSAPAAPKPDWDEFASSPGFPV
jgi:hypothetical protein